MNKGLTLILLILLLCVGIVVGLTIDYQHKGIKVIHYYTIDCSDEKAIDGNVSKIAEEIRLYNNFSLSGVK